jgi:hypothetical protein
MYMSSVAARRLQELGLLSPVECVQWLTASPLLQFGPAPHEAAASDAWALLHSILAGTLARYEGALQHRARLQDGVKKARTKLNAASEESAAAVEAQQQAEEAAARGEDDAADGSNAQRQRIVWPGGEGGGSRSGPVHRAEVAALREQLMAKKLAAAEEALSQHEAQLAGLEGVRGVTLLQVRGRRQQEQQQQAGYWMSVGSAVSCGVACVVLQAFCGLTSTTYCSSTMRACTLLLTTHNSLTCTLCCLNAP